MERDASLDEFLGEGGSEEPTDQPVAEEERDPATVTARWDPDGGPCADCGAVTAERWVVDDAFVCDACKDW